MGVPLPRKWNAHQTHVGVDPFLAATALASSGVVGFGDWFGFGGANFAQVHGGSCDYGSGQDSLCRFWKDKNQNREVPLHSNSAEEGALLYADSNLS